MSRTEPTKSSERYELVERLYQQVVDLAPERRARFLTEHCPDDGELRREIESLVAHYDLAGEDFLDQAVHRLADGPAMPRRIGRFEIVTVLGHGGMGVVYEARQDHPRRSVAVKVIRPGIPSPAALRRFEHESEILGRLQHPGIAHVYEAGIAEIVTEAGSAAAQPYFAMELVRGTPLHRYARENSLNTRERLALFLQVCDAVEYAHRKGVIHRDLKPANILVVHESGAREDGRADGDTSPGFQRARPSPVTAQPKILDFGVARVMDSDVQVTTMHTDASQLIGTLPYMSPEQVSGNADQLDTRSDVYALGVILYELLADQLPYDVRDKPLAVAARVITEQPPTSLASKDRALRGDLDTIVAKALEKDPARRYESVHQLSADVRRHLNHEPISARPASAVYQFRRFAQRNMGLVGGAAATLVALILGLTFTGTALWAAAQERDAKHRALTAEQQARGESEAVTQFLSEMLASADPEREGRDVRVIDVLETASQRIDEEFAGQPLIAARLHHVVGRTYQKLGVYERAAAHLTTALELRTDLLGERHPDTLESMHELGVAYLHAARYELAQPLLERALELAAEVLGETSEQTLATMSELALLHTRMGRYDLSAPLRQRCLDSMREVLGPTHPETLSAMNNLGVLYKRLGRYDEAEALYEQTLESRRRILGEEHPQTLTSMNNLAHLYYAQARYAESADLHLQTLAIRRRVLGDEHPHTQFSIDNSAMALLGLGRFDEAEELFDEALRLKRRTLGPEHPEVLVTMNNLGRTYMNQGRYAESEALHRKTLALRRRILGDEQRSTTISMDNLAQVLVRLERYDEADALYNEALEIRRRKFGEDHPEVGRSLHYLAQSAAQRGDDVAAASLYEQAIAIFERRLRPDHKRAVKARLEFSEILQRQGRRREAAQMLEGLPGVLAESNPLSEEVDKRLRSIGQ